MSSSVNYDRPVICPILSEKARAQDFDVDYDNPVDPYDEYGYDYDRQYMSEESYSEGSTDSFEKRDLYSIAESRRPNLKYSRPNRPLISLSVKGG